jgi:hypothetical protein
MSAIGGMTFWIDLNSIEDEELDNIAISNLLSVDVQDGRINAPEGLKHDPDKPYVFYQEIVWLLDLIEQESKELKQLGVCMEQSSIWVIYEYFAQCNMEYDASVLKRVGDLGLKLCISCYEDTELANRESFESSLISKVDEGIWVTTTTGKDIKLCDIFPVSIEIENGRKDHSFILTTIELGCEFISHFDIINFSKPPNSIDEYEGNQSFVYDVIIEPMTSLKIDIFLKAKEIGVFRGSISVQEKYNYIENEISAVIEK